MKPEIIIPGLGFLRMYDILLAAGTILGNLIFLYWGNKILRDWKKLILVIAVTDGLFVLSSYSGEFLERLTYWEWSNFREFLEDLSVYGGMHYLGRVLFLAAAVPFIYRLMLRDKIKRRQMLDLFGFIIVIQHMFNRVACLCNGCCYGKPYHGSLSVTYTEGVAYHKGVTWPVYPTQLMEAGMMILLLVLMVFWKHRGKTVFEKALTGFALAIFISEFFMDNIGSVLVLGLTWIQIGSLLLIIYAAGYHLLNRRKGG